MTFLDEAERQAWSSVCAKVAAMRERRDDPTAAIKPEAPSTIPGVKPMDPLSGLVRAMDPAPNTGSPPPGGGRIHYAIQRGAEVAWQRMWVRRLHLSHCEADRAHVIDCIYDAMVDSVVEHPFGIDTAKMGDMSAVNQCAPDTIAPAPSERPALERVRAALQMKLDEYRERDIASSVASYVAGRQEALAEVVRAITEELAKQPEPEPELPEKVKAVVEAAREVTRRWLHRDLIAALKALDEEAK